MSDYGEEEDKPKEPVREEPGKRIFLNNINTFTGKAVYSELKNEHTVKESYAAHTFYATKSKTT